MNQLNYTSDAPFWYLLAKRVMKRAQTNLPFLFESLSKRASELELPITYGGTKSLSWAVICHLFVLYDVNAPTMGRKGFSRMTAGFKRAFEPRRFPQIAIKRIVANITYPFSPDRTIKESVADTFLANGLTVTEEYDDTSWDDIILSRSIADPEMMSLCDRIVTPPSDIWEYTVQYYTQHRPGFFYRLSFNARNWLID
jgi:hypothetical protein